MRIKEGIEHQGIGGQEFIIDEFVTETLTNEKCLEEACTGNWACHNFMERRPDFKYKFPHKLYYVKVNGLGYVIAEDEIERGEESE